MRAALAAIAVAGSMLPLLAGCSGEGSFPAPAECVQAAPLPTATPGVPQRGAYFSALRNGADELESQLGEFRANWPSGSFSRNTEFRLDFAKYSDETRCMATYMRDLQPPGPEFAAFDENLGKALDDLIAHTEFGRESVRKRNVSEWRQWRDGAEGKVEAVRTALRSR
jgi:hypothetical protein